MLAGAIIRTVTQFRGGDDMDTASLLIRAMAEECRRVILESNESNVALPESLQPKHLERMCDRIKEHAENWSTAKLHRWIGFIQGAMMANRMLDLDGIKAMFDKAKNAYGESNEDLLDHLDPRNPFKLDIGGEG